ncbi:MAG: elongation factor P [bacterium]
MVTTNDFDTGMAIYVDGELCEILNYEHSKKARGSAFVRTKLRNLDSGEVIEKTFQSGDDFEQAIIEDIPAEYLYDSGQFHVFMNMETYDQVELSSDVVGDKADYLRENMELHLEYCDEDPIGVTLPPQVTLTVEDTSPGVKGDTAQGGTKPATTDTGLTVDVPLFVSEGDDIVVNTETGEYVGRSED